MKSQKKFGNHFITDKNQFDIAEKCSIHAINDSADKEFVAEIYSGILNDETYDEEIMNIYRAIKCSRI